MKPLLSLYDSRDNNYVLYHSALLLFTLTIIIPLNFHFTKLPIYITGILFAVGFVSLFMIARNEKVEAGFQKIKAAIVEKPSSEQLLAYKPQRETTLPQKIQDQFELNDDLQEPLYLLSNCIKDISSKHERLMDLETIDGFHKLNDRLTQLIAVKPK